MARVLVAGASNQVAAYLIGALIERGDEVVALSRRERPPWIAPHPALEWRRLDLTDEIPDLQAETLFYLAPLLLVDRLASRLAGCSRGIVFSSTSAETKAASGHAGEKRIAAMLKQGEELAADSLGQRGTGVTILRPTLIYGAGLDRNLTRVAGWIRRVGIVPLLGTGSGLRQPIHAEDLARSAILATGATVAKGRTYSVAGGSTLPYREMVSAIFGSLGRKPRFVRVPSPLISLSVPLLRLHPRYRDLTPEMFRRMDRDLVIDDSSARRDFGHDPRPFAPTAETWVRLDRR